MDSDEHQIYSYLKQRRREHLSVREICRLAGGKRRFRREPDWAHPVLARMLRRRIVEMDPAGHYRLKPPEKKAGQDEGQKGDNKTKRWISPQIQGMLRGSGKDFSEVLPAEDDLDFYYDTL